MIPADEQLQAEGGARPIEEELGALRAIVEDTIAEANGSAIAAARGDLVVALASLGTLEFDLEARFHLARLDPTINESEQVAIARHLVRGDVQGALDRLTAAVVGPAIDVAPLLKLTFSAVLRAGPACPELPWLKGLLCRIPALTERGVAATQLIRFLPPGTRTRGEMAAAAAECVGALWPESPQLAGGLLGMTCQALVDANDQPLLATIAEILLQSLPRGHTVERNTVGFLLITSLSNSGDIGACVKALRDLLGTLVSETWDRANFDLLKSIASVAAEVAATALASGATDLAAQAVAIADRAFGQIERIDPTDVEETEQTRLETAQGLSKTFSRVAAVARSLTQARALEISQPDPAPAFRFGPEDAAAPATPGSPHRSARISEARFLEECARVGWKAIPTPLEVDFGLDYRIEIPELPSRISADVEFLVQLKSTSARPNKSGMLTVSIDLATLKYWKSKVLPTLVVLFHHPTDTFYTSWYFPALDDATRRTFRFAREDEWDPITLRTDVRRYYQHVRAALASGGDWSVLSVMQFHCALLIKLLLLHPDVRRAALDPDADDLGAPLTEPEDVQTILMLLSMHHRALCAPAPILAGQPQAADIVPIQRTLDAIVRSWTIAGRQVSEEVQFMIVGTHGFFKSCRDLLHVAVELDCALASAIVAAQEARSAALAGPAHEGE